ncbi:hypothetical protein [Actinomadura sp. 7K507]|uniref:hypothetical protein n=1 Tax=Actinomadura sp. 7K507 TaxID=2530365 RepID=UPI00104570BA|nr:hypothetical protein [Actinomadura sp. 7K507]TDC73852.1 hypothetical protein E1285_44185 [Actinomadura sp. 7K507]
MAEAGAEEFAEYGAAALDSFQALFEQTEHLNHRTNDDHARELLGDLLIDLMHYAEHRDLEFNDILAQAQGYYLSEQANSSVFPIGSTVQREGPAADEAILLGQPTRGTVTGILVPDHGPTEYYVGFLGQTTNHKTIAADLEPAPPFPATTTTQGVINDPLRAEATLVETMTRIANAESQGVQPQKGELNDQRSLLNALVAWNGMDKRNVTDLLLAKIETRLPTDSQHPPTAPDAPLSPGQLAAQAFPSPLPQGLTNPQDSSSRRPADTTPPRPRRSR